MTQGSDAGGRGRSEPVFNAPRCVAGLILVLIALHAARLLAGVDTERFAASSADLDKGRWTGLITYIFVHGNWAHVLFNSAFVLTFGAPVARYLGAGLRGAALFVGFFLVCGVLAALAYAGWRDLATAFGGRAMAWSMVGASGAASGLLGAAVRLMEGRGRLGPINGGGVPAMTVGWIVANAVLGVSGLTPGAAGAPVAWEAHIFGYFAGLALIGLFGRARAAAVAPLTQ